MKRLLWVLIAMMLMLLAGALLRGTDPKSNSEQSSPHSLQTNPPD